MDGGLDVKKKNWDDEIEFSFTRTHAHTHRVFCD